MLTSIKDVPNRPLTIDEVRNLINHATTPNTDVAPEAPSKPLNDPHDQPEPLRDDPSPSSDSNSSADPAPSPSPNASDDDKNDPVPPPGTMAEHLAPEPDTSEPLPQR